MEAMYDGLRFFEDLQLLGWVIYVDDKPVGLYYREIQLPSTFIVHCAKALPNIKGLGAFIQIEATKNLPPFISYQLKILKLQFSPVSGAKRFNCFC
jgi:hypothetical protein